MRQLSSYTSIARWLLSYWKDFRGQALLNTFLGISLVGLNLGLVAATKLTIDIATGQCRDFTLLQGLSLIGGIILTQVFLGFVSRWVKAVLGVRSQNRMQRRLFHRLLCGDWSSLRQYHSGDVLNRMLKDVSNIVSLLTEDIPAILTTLVQFIGAFLLLYYMDRHLALIVVIIAPFFILVSKLYVRRLRRLTHEVREADSGIQAMMQESMQHSLVIKTLERVEHVVGKLAQQQGHLRACVMHKTTYSSISAMVMSLGFGIGYMVTFAWGVYQLQEGTGGYGQFLAFIQLIGQMQSPVRALSQYIPVLISAATASERLMEMEQMPLEKSMLEVSSLRETPQSGRENILPAPEPIDTLLLENVDYTYVNGSRPILQNFSYSFPPGSITAIQGETGAGKTTLIRLLLALVAPLKGKVGFRSPDGRFSAIDVTSRRRFSYVPQGNTLLSGTIRENLLLGNPFAHEAEMWRALHVATADFVKQLPLRLDTLCTEMGGGFSEGQAQRLCIARTLLRDSEVMIFDESTSALDAETESKVIERIIDYCQGRTLIFITHRPSVLKFCTQHLKLSRHSSFPEQSLC